MYKKFVEGSFRDPSGRVFYYNDSLYREVNDCFAKDYDKLMTSGLYSELINSNELITHEEIRLPELENQNTYKILKPDFIPFISYPYEWSFSQLKDAALLTLSIQKKALEYGMTLKDASAYNVQFKGCRPIFIDTLSFESYRIVEPWVAYRQFCQHFLAPLLVCSMTDIRLGRLLQLYIDGIPLDIASSLLPWKSRFNFGALIHVHMHAKYQNKYAQYARKTDNRQQNQAVNVQALIENLESVIKKITWAPSGTEWADYYLEGSNNYSDETLNNKISIVSRCLDVIKPNHVWDIGANNGFYSRIASDKGIRTISMDIDAAAVELNYLRAKDNIDFNLLPLLIDLCNPSPSSGWNLMERMSLFDRGPADMVVALALIHHLVIGNNVPLSSIARLFSRLGKFLLLEFVPKEDSQVQLMLASRKDIFEDYDIIHFRKIFGQYYEIIEEIPLENSYRTIFLMQATN